MGFDPLTYTLPVSHVFDDLEALLEENVEGINAPLKQRTLLRLPAVPDKMGSRDLPNAAWDTSTLDIIACAGICILHAAMRTGEANLRHLLAVNPP